MKGEKFLTSYFNLQKVLYEEYPKKSLLLMQKGLFYEIYAMPEDPIFSEVCDLLGILQTRVDKSLPISIDNPRFAGFPIDSANRHLKALAENEYTVRIIDETTKEGKVITRNVTRTINNTSLIDDLSKDTKWIVYIVIIENEKNSEMAITCMNLQIGEVFIYPDQAFDIDYLQEILAKYNCGEIVIHTNSKKDQIIDKKYTLVNSPSSLKIGYKEEFLQKIYKKTIGISLLESFNLELLQIASNTFVHLLNHALKYDCSLVRKIYPPQIIFNNNILHLSENAIKQLDIELILKTIDYTYTKMGSRLLRKRIYNPYTQATDISCDTLDISPDNLKNIKDIDKLWKKISSLYASHRDIVTLYSSLEAVKNLFAQSDLKESITQPMKNNLNKAIHYICKRINIDDEVNIIKQGYSEVIDNIKQAKSEKLSILNEIRIDIHPYLLLFRGKDKFYFSCDSKTKREILSKENKYKINATNCTKHWKITDSRCEPLFGELLKLENRYEKEMKKCLRKFCVDFSDIFNEFIYKLSKKIAHIDLALCNYTLMAKYGFSKPNIKNEEKEGGNNSLTFEGLFHPVSKNLSTGFIPQDLTLSGGMLLYGVNFSGKSTLLRSVGIAVILAQAGLPIPAKTMTFTPFTRLYTKISLGDNYVKGQSTFTNEIYEMKKMVNLCDKYTLILADELCSGTEINSAVALVASSIMSISKNSGKFIFTTHYHSLAELEEVKATNTEIYHMSVERTKEGGFKFNRKLEKGKCGDIYGIEIAIHMDMSNDFIMNASRIRNKLVNGDFLSQKTSRYNSDVYMSECKLCGDKESLHTHHIKFQKDFSPMNKTKNYKGNLIVLCESCHTKLHHNQITFITGYKETTEGVVVE